jgi:glycosyltransferase involved in cell wall biosynthesis
MLAACPFPANHGTPGSIREMAEAVAERGHEVHIVTYHIGEDIPLKGATVHRITPLTREREVVVGPTVRRPLYDLQMVPKALEVIRRYNCDVIQAHGYEACLVAWLCKAVTGLPVVYNGHNTMEDELPTYNFIRPRWLAVALGKLLDGFVPRIADRCLPHSVNMEEFFQRRGLRTRTDPVLKIGIDLDREVTGDPGQVRRRYGLDGRPVVLYSGVIDEFQRLDLLLEAMVTVGRAEPEARLLIVTTVPNARQLAALHRKAEELGVTRRVVVTEPMALQDLPLFLRACDVAVVPRPQTPGFPMKMVNYMAARRPAVLYASSAFGGLVHGHNAYFASPDTGEALGQALVNVLRDAQLRRRLAATGHRFVREHHDRRVTARQVCETYFRTLAEAGRLPRFAPQSTPDGVVPIAPARPAAATLPLGEPGAAQRPTVALVEASA